MSSDKDQRDELNPSQVKYEGDFNGGQKQHPSEEFEFKYSPDEDRNELARNEKSGGTNALQKSKAAAKTELSNHKTNLEKSRLGNIAQNAKSKLAARFIGSNRSKTKKRLMLGIFGIFGSGIAVVGFILLFMMLSGFGVKQAAVVAKGYGMYRLNRLSNAVTSRVLEADIKVKKGGGLGKVAPSSAADKLRGFDIERVMKNLEKEGTVKYTRGPGGKVKGVIIGDGEEILMEGTKNPLKRADIFNKLSADLSEYAPELTERTTLVGKTSDAIFERTNLKRLRWSEKVLAAHRKTDFDAEKALGIDQEAELKAVRGDPNLPKTGDAGVDAARDIADKEMPTRSAAGELEPHQKIVPDQLVAIEDSSRLLSKIGAIGEVVEGASTVVVYTACTVNAVTESARQSIDQNNDSSIRAAGKLQSASDQISSGNVTAMSVGSSRKMLGENFADQAGYQRSTYNTNWAAYQQLPETDFPQPNISKGWLGTFANISEVSNKAWDSFKTSTNVSTLGLTWVGDKLGIGPADWTFTDFCGAINTPAGGVIFGLLSSVLEQALVGVFTGGAGEAATQPTKLGTREFIGKVIDTIVQKGVLSSLKSLAIGKAERYTEKKVGEGILRAILKNMFKQGAKLGIEAGATVGLAYLVIKTANNSGGYVYSGVSDDQFVNKAVAGTNVMEQDFNRSRFQGIPLDDGEVKTAQLEQYDTYLAKQANKSFYGRLFNINDPYSASSRIAVRAPVSSGGVKQLALNSLNPLSLISPSENVFSRFAKNSLIDQHKTYASSLSDTELTTDGVIQWGYTEPEMALMQNDEYSLVSVSEWANTEEGKDAIKTLNKKYGFCYDTKYEMSDIILSDGTSNAKVLKDRDGNDISNAKKRCLVDLPQENKSNRGVFKWRLLNSDSIATSELIDLQTVTEDQSAGSSSTVEPGAISSDSSATPCYAGTEDLGIRDDAYTKGNRIKIRLCAINSIPGTSEESTSTVTGAKGRALSSSIASEAWQKLGEAAKAAGVPLSAGSSWRTMAHQEQLCRGDDKCPNGNYNDVAKPGTSNHQAGTAMDISQIYKSVSGPSSGRKCSNPQTSEDATYKWIAANARTYGIKNYANEAWHWGTSEAC